MMKKSLIFALIFIYVIGIYPGLSNTNTASADIYIYRFSSPGFFSSPSIIEIIEFNDVLKDEDSFAKLEKVGESASPAVVLIEGHKEIPVYSFRREGNRKYREQIGTVERRVSSGSGFFINSDGYIVTNKHVVDDTESTYVVYNGDEEIEARVVYKDPNNDLAVIKIAGDKYPFIRLSDSSDLRVGEEVVSVGNALGRFVDSVSAGRILSLNEKILAHGGDAPQRLNGLIATDAKLYPGDSGGPLLNEEGEVVGVNVAIAVGRDLSFSIPVEAAISAVRKAGVSI
jgi:serine protease Do